MFNDLPIKSTIFETLETSEQKKDLLRNIKQSQHGKKTIPSSEELQVRKNHCLDRIERLQVPS